MSHNWIKMYEPTMEEQLSDNYIEYSCSICKLRGFSDSRESHSKIYLYAKLNNLIDKRYSLVGQENIITCEEFIIKKIIE